MANLVNSILRQADKNREKYILTAPTHESYETCLTSTGYRFLSLNHPSFKKWNSLYRKVPKNYLLLDSQDEIGKYPVDVVLSQNKFGQYQLLHQVAFNINAPLISLEHTLPMPNWSDEQRKLCKDMRGNLNVFISEYSVDKWGFSLSDPTVRVIKHGIDTDMFKPTAEDRINRILCVVNDWINRDWCCNFACFERTASDLPCLVLGDTPGLSKPASSTEELIKAYSESSIFYNTSTISPVPTALMEAMACGCAVVSTATCMIPEIIEHGVNGFMSNDESELKKYLYMLLNDKELAKKIGYNARQSIVEKFNLRMFQDNWKSIINEACEIKSCR